MARHKIGVIIDNIRFAIKDNFRSNKLRILLISFFIVLGFLTGIFLAIKAYSIGTIEYLCEKLLSPFETGTMGSVSVFFTRFFSLVFIIGVLTLCAKVRWLSVFGYALIAYRAYLFGVNFVMLLLLYGLTGVFVAIFVVLPCQIITLFIISLYFCITAKSFCECRVYGTNFPFLQSLLFCLVAILVIDMIEVILLLLFQGKLIFII